jgi:N utilization substance protein A
VNELGRAIEQAARDKGIDKGIIVQALEQAIEAAARKRYPNKANLEVHFNDELGELELFEFKDVVEVIENDESQLTPDQARELDPDAQIGDSLGMKMEVGDLLGRIAAQNAKQVIIQKVREAEKAIIYEEYKDRKGDLINGIIRRVERGNVIVDLGRTEAILPRSEQIPRESYRPDERIRAFVVDIQQNARGPAIVLSRSHPNFIRKLFELEVPEIHEGVVEIKAIAREPGNRAKVAVFSYEKDVDPVGACVGMKGSRVQNVVQELKGEKIDIIQWSDDPAKLIENALSPADISQVIIDEIDRKMEVIVPDDQLSLAIGRKGQNVKLAVQLTGWNVDIRSESEVMEAGKKVKAALGQVPDMSDTAIELLYQAGIGSIEDLANADAAQLASESDIALEKVQLLIANAKQVLVEAAAKAERVSKWEAKPLTELPNADEEAVKALANSGIRTIRQLADAGPKALGAVDGHAEKVHELQKEACKVLELPEPIQAEENTTAGAASGAEASNG